MLAIYAIHWSRGSWGATKSFPTTCLLGVVAKNAGICWNRMTLFISLFTIKTANLKTSGFVEKPRVFFISHVFVGFWVSRYIYIYPPCIAHYKVDILCAYKVGFRSPLYIPTMGDKAVFCARNMPLDLEDDFIATLAFQFIPGWFPTRKRLNICGNAFYRPLVPFKEWP